METETPTKGAVAETKAEPTREDLIARLDDPMWLLRRAYHFLEVEREPEVTND